MPAFQYVFFGNGLFLTCCFTSTFFVVTSLIELGLVLPVLSLHTDTDGFIFFVFITDNNGMLLSSVDLQFNVESGVQGVGYGAVLVDGCDGKL